MDPRKVINTVRYMTPRQWKYRFYYTGRRILKKRVPKGAKHLIQPFLLPAYYKSDIDNKDTTVADGILRNEIPTVSPKIAVFDGNWDLNNEDYRLVSFKLNSFRWLLELSDAYKATGDRKYIDKGLDLIKDWHIQCGDKISGDKWNAYVIAERVTNWIGFCSEYAVDDIADYAGMIYPQALELKDSLEYQLGANHLLSEAKALVYVGTFLKNDNLYRTGKELLIDEAKEQFYPDGGHYEQSVSYHVESLQQYFEAYAAMKANGDTDAEKFADLMREPYRFLNGMIGVNGNIPLFNDSAYDYPFYDACDLLSTASYLYSADPPRGRKGTYYNRWSWLKTEKGSITWEEKTKYDNTGFIHYKFDRRGEEYSFFMDCGNNGPDYNLGHTHADALSVILYSEKKDILVDSGVFTYKPGIERDECRSTKAHNTVEIDGKNSAEIWSAFRVARRGHTKVLDYDVEVGLRVKALHDGYKKILKDPVEHFREVLVKDGRIEISDSLLSKREHKAISRFHIGPECKIKQINLHKCLVDECIFIESDDEIKLKDCYVSGMFGIKNQTKCIEIDFKKNNKTIIEIK